MKMITKVFLVIAILLICLIVWSLFLGNGGILQATWNGIADMVNTTWESLTGDSDGIMPEWKEDTDDIAGGTGGLDDAGP